MELSTIIFEEDSRGVAKLTLDRPEVHNALSSLMLREISYIADQVELSKTVRVLVLVGSGISFCAGGDLKWMEEQFSASEEEREKQVRLLAGMLYKLYSLSKPLVVCANGQAYGGGVGLMSVADVTVAIDTARFGLTETRLGIIPATIFPYVLAKMGESATRRNVTSARIFDAVEAMAMGLVDRIVTKETLEEVLEEEASLYLKVAPGAVAKAKSVCQKLGGTVNPVVIEDSIRDLVEIWGTDEAVEGIRSFLGKKKPYWYK